MGIGGPFKFRSQVGDSLSKLRNNPDHEKLAKTLGEVAKQLDTSLKKEGQSISTTDKNKLLAEAEKVFHNTAVQAKNTKTKIIDYDNYVLEEMTLLAAHQQILKMIPHITQEEFDKQMARARDAMVEDRHRLTEQLARAATDKSNSLEDRANSMAKLVKHFADALPSVEDMAKLDRKTQNNLVELQSTILTTNAQINLMHKDVKPIEVSLTNIQDPDKKTLVFVLSSESIVEDVINRYLMYRADIQRKGGTTGEEDDGEDEEAPDLYRREKIDKFRRGGHWWHLVTQADSLQPFADSEGKVAFDYVSMEEDSYTLAVVDDGKKELGLPLVLCKKKSQAGQVQETIEAELKKILPEGRIVAIKSFGNKFNSEKSVCEYPLLSSYFKPRHTEFYVEVDSKNEVGIRGSSGTTTSPMESKVQENMAGQLRPRSLTVYLYRQAQSPRKIADFLNYTYIHAANLLEAAREVLTFQTLCFHLANQAFFLVLSLNEEVKDNSPNFEQMDDGMELNDDFMHAYSVIRRYTNMTPDHMSISVEVNQLTTLYKVLFTKKRSFYSAIRYPKLDATWTRLMREERRLLEKPVDNPSTGSQSSLSITEQQETQGPV